MFSSRSRWLLLAFVGLVLASIAGAKYAQRLRTAPTSASQAAPVPVAQPGDVDLGFTRAMTVHHLQAVQMAQIAQTQGTGQIQNLAQRIRDTQNREAGIMQGWMMLWQPGGAIDSDDMQWMSRAYRQAKKKPDEEFQAFVDTCEASGAMPGMASPQELEQLASLKGVAFDQQFLLMMIRHHQGALVMARFAHEYAQMPIVKQLALNMYMDQSKEMALMGGLYRRSVKSL